MNLFCFFLLLTSLPSGYGVGVARTALRLEQVTGDLKNPVAVVNAGDGSDRLFVAEIEGRIRVVEANQLRAESFLDITDRVEQFENGGLLGLAFHPDYEETGRFFVHYVGRTSTGELETVIAEHQVSPDDPNRADPTGKRLLSIGRPTAVHPGGDLAFGLDGLLYISSGDDGLMQAQSTGQNPGDLLGKILRIDVDHGELYSIPTSNPFVDQEGFLPEIWSLGFRNPFRMSFDSRGGRLFVGDVGHGRREEINVVRRGENYGWNQTEGTLCFEYFPNCNPETFTPPIYEYNHGDGASVIGGRVYRGQMSPWLYGSYIFSDFVTRQIWLLQEQGRDRWIRSELLKPDFRTVAFGEDEAGELYLVNLLGNSLYRLDFTQRVTLPVFAGGSLAGLHFSSRLIASNPEPEPSLVEAAILDRRGRKIDELSLHPKPASSGFSVPPNETVHFDLLPGPAFQTGWLDVEIRGGARVSLELSASGPDPDSSASTLVSPASLSRDFVGSAIWDPARQESTALVLVNATRERFVIVEVIVRDDESEIRGSFPLLLGPGFSTSFFLDEDLADKTPFQGTVTIHSSKPVTAALFRTRNGLLVSQLDMASRN